MTSHALRQHKLTPYHPRSDSKAQLTSELLKSRPGRRPLSRLRGLLPRVARDLQVVLEAHLLPAVPGQQQNLATMVTGRQPTLIRPYLRRLS